MKWDGSFLTFSLCFATLVSLHPAAPLLPRVLHDDNSFMVRIKISVSNMQPPHTPTVPMATGRHGQATMLGDLVCMGSEGAIICSEEILKLRNPFSAPALYSAGRAQRELTPLSQGVLCLSSGMIQLAIPYPPALYCMSSLSISIRCLAKVRTHASACCPMPLSPGLLMKTSKVGWAGKGLSFL